MKKKNIIFAAVLLLGAAATLSAQVTMGSDKVPENFSVLELISNSTKGIRLPQLTTAQRDAMEATAEFQAEKTAEAMGLTIFNTTVRCVQTWNGTVWLSPCDETCEDCAETALITTFVNVMYDFQHQTLEAYDVPNASEHQWQVRSADETAFKNIAGANSPTYKIGEHYIDSYGNDTLYFRCLMNTAAGARVKTPEFEMLFIRTNTAGYGGIGTDNPYLTIQNGGGGTFKLSLLNLGQSANKTSGSQTGTGLPPAYVPNNDAGDLGDFYQWGRVADGHETATWSKDYDIGDPANPASNYYYNKISDSGEIDHDATIAVDGDGQIISNTPHYGKFITTPSQPYDWSTSATGGVRWGNGNDPDTRDSDIQPAEWTHPDNNPCPAGWGVPTQWNWWDMLQGDGVNNNLPVGNLPFDNYNMLAATVNIWEWRPNDTNKAYGGIIITNGSGEKVFLPVTSYRSFSGGHLFTPNDPESYYWTCTGNTLTDSNPAGLFFGRSWLTGNDVVHWDAPEAANGAPVRCVQEVPAP